MRMSDKLEVYTSDHVDMSLDERLKPRYPSEILPPFVLRARA